MAQFALRTEAVRTAGADAQAVAIEAHPALESIQLGCRVFGIASIL